MNKILLSILLVSVVAVQSCQKKASDDTADTTARDSPSSAMNNSPIPTGHYIPNYTTPPSNRVADAIAWTAQTLNNRDSAGFWSSFTWENRDSMGYTELYLETRTLWDSTKGSHVDVKVLSTNVFTHSVHETKDLALFAHAVINMRITGAKTKQFDTMSAILRVENGKWLLGSFSQSDPNKPFQVE